MGRQFRGILPFFQDHGAAERMKEHVLLQKEKEKCRHHASAHDLPVIPVGSTVTYINRDLKTWFIGRVEAMKADPIWWPQKKEGWSRNQVHLLKTNVSFGMPTTSPNKSLVRRLDMPIKTLNMNNQTGQPTIKPEPKAKESSPVSTPAMGELRTRSGRLVKKPPRYQE